MSRSVGIGAAAMTWVLPTVMPEQARAAHLAYDRLCQYLDSGVASFVPSVAEFVELTYGNFLVAETLVGVLATLRGKTFDQVLEELPERDEGYPPGPAARYGWETAVYRLGHLHARSWRRRPESSQLYDLPTACRGSFNLVVAAVMEVAAETNKAAPEVAGLLKDAASAAVT